MLNGFDDPVLGRDAWNRLAHRGDTDTVFQTWQWQRAWWETLGRGRLLLVAAESDGEIVALGPLYADEGMIFFLGCGDSHYLDFIGDISATEVLDAILDEARAAVADFAGFKFHWMLDRSRTRQRLEEAASRLGLEYFTEAILPAVEVDLSMAEVRTALNRRMKKREDYFRERGSFVVKQFRDSDEIRPQLEEFYAQHLARWRIKTSPSRFADMGQRAFLARLLELTSETGWVRFLRIEWQGKPLAFEYGVYHSGCHYSAGWSFAIELGRHSPGHVLLRQSLLAAINEGLSTYDFGPGDQDYKFRLPVRVRDLYTVGLYEQEK